MTTGKTKTRHLTQHIMVRDRYLFCGKNNAGTERLLVVYAIRANRTIFSEDPQNRLNITQNYDVIRHTRDSQRSNTTKNRNTHLST